MRYPLMYLEDKSLKLGIGVIFQVLEIEVLTC